MLRLSNKIEGQRVAQIKQTLSESLSRECGDDEAADRLRFERRHTEYQWLADQQIMAISTALSISTIKHTQEDEVLSTVTSKKSFDIADERDEDQLMAKAFNEGVARLMIED